MKKFTFLKGLKIGAIVVAVFVLVLLVANFAPTRNSQMASAGIANLTWLNPLSWGKDKKPSGWVPPPTPTPSGWVAPPSGWVPPPAETPKPSVPPKKK